MTEKQLIRWFKTHIKDGESPYFLDKHQAAIVLDEHQNTLVTARAGSGKTRTIVAKIAYLVATKKATEKEIICFAFNKKARAEINQRLSEITFDGRAIFSEKPTIASTFHAFSYNALGGKQIIKNRIITEDHQTRLITAILKHLSGSKPQDSDVTAAIQFITRAEQQFFLDYSALSCRVQEDRRLQLFYQAFQIYQKYLKNHDLINFNQMMAQAAANLKTTYPYKYFFVDEYQDFSLLFLNLIRALLGRCHQPHLLAVGDDWQAINRFAGSNVEYFKNFAKYFSTDSAKLFIPTNYRSGKLIVKNANLFMLSSLHDPAGCKSKGAKKSHIFLADLSKMPDPHCAKLSNALKLSSQTSPPLNLIKQLQLVLNIIKNHPDSSIKLLHRNNHFNAAEYSLELFLEAARNLSGRDDITATTVHRSKGLESDVVILLEVDAEKFPSRDKSGGLFTIFGDTPKTLLEDEFRLFYVALTRAKTDLCIITKNTKITKQNQKFNFLNYLNPDYLTHLSSLFCSADPFS